jgi:hypothetical protein
MNKIFFLILFVIQSLVSLSQSITNITVSQRQDGSEKVDVYYFFLGSEGAYYISAEVSLDDGTNWQSITNLHGDVYRVTPGNRQLVWNAGVEMPGVYVSNARIKLTAYEANHVKLFMDVNPWDSDAIIELLTSEGFTQGTGPNTYEIILSSEMGTVSLIPGVDLVIICDDQHQTFYNNYAQNQVRFTNFVYMGGSILWEACDYGWNEGLMADAGIILPGNIVSDLKWDYYNYVTDQNLPLVAGLPYQMDHNYASHERFIEVPDGTTVYCVDSDSEPTLIECNLGDGWIIVSGQPLEHQYDHIYGSPDMEELLPRIIAYFTGNPLPTKNGLRNQPLIPSTVSSFKTK